MDEIGEIRWCEAYQDKPEAQTERCAVCEWFEGCWGPGRNGRVK